MTDERKAFSAWWASRPVTVLNAHEGLALMVWQAATAAERERAAKVCDRIAADMRSHGWDTASSAVEGVGNTIRQG